MRLSRHTEWEAGDRQEHAARAAAERHLQDCLLTFLRTRPDLRCEVDAFMAAYPSLPQNVARRGAAAALPPRGDLGGFVRRHPQAFAYEGERWVISLRPQALKSPPGPAPPTLPCGSPRV